MAIGSHSWRGRPSDSQVRWGRGMLALGHQHAVCYDVGEFITTVTAYLSPRPTIKAITGDTSWAREAGTEP